MTVERDPSPDCMVGQRGCDGPGTYRCDDDLWGSRCRAWQRRNGGHRSPDELEVAEPEPAEALARAFHEAYERLAPRFSYSTREASAKPWAQVPVRNRRLMIAVAAELLRGRVALHEHDERRCCPEHEHHVIPHRGCALR